MPEAKKWTRKEVRQEARRFAAAQISSQDQPDWVEDAGIPQAEWDTFMDELQCVSKRILATIKE